MGKSEILPTWEGEYIHDGERKVCKFHITKRDRGKYIVYRMQASPKGQSRFSVERQTLEDLKVEFRKWQSSNRPKTDSLERKLTRLSEEEILDAENAVRALPKGLTLEKAVSIAKDIFTGKAITFSDAYKEYVKIQSRTNENRDGGWGSKKTQVEFLTIMKYPRLHFDQRIVNTITSDELKDYWNKGNRELGSKTKKRIFIANQTRLNRYKVIQKFFKWCFDKGYHYKNIMGVNLQASPKIKKGEKDPPDVIDNNCVIQILEYCRDTSKYNSWVPFVSLLFFAGLRSSEIHGGKMEAKKKERHQHKALDWDNFRFNPNIGEPYLQLPYTGKMQSNRIVKLPSNLVRLLKFSKKNGIEVFCPKITSQTYKTFRKEVGLDSSKPNAPRHTAISNWFRHNPFTKKPATTQELTDQFGNAEDTRAEFYINTESIGIDTAIEFWDITNEWNAL